MDRAEEIEGIGCTKRRPSGVLVDGQQDDTGDLETQWHQECAEKRLHEYSKLPLEALVASSRRSLIEAPGLVE